MDNHASHVTIEAITFCRENGIVILGFPPHTSHRLQPLDVGFYGPLKTAYSQACDDILVSNPGICISITHVPQLFSTAYFKVATIQTAVNAFRATGIEPFDSNIFRDEDFQPSLITDIQSVDSTAPACGRRPELLFENTGSAITHTANDSFENQHPEPQPELILSTSLVLPPLPVVASKKTARKPRKKLPSFHLSGTPVKEALEQKRKEQEEKKLKRQKRLTEKAKKKKPRCRLDFASSSDDEPSNRVPYIDTDDDMDPPEEEDKLCIICSEEGKDELWYQCYKCLKWAHSECSGWDRIQASLRPYKCDFCT